MTVDVSSLARRSPAALRSYVQVPHVYAERNPKMVQQSQPSDRDYWRYLIQRVPLEGICAYYQTYDNAGDENDWNINIVPEAGYQWMVDREILHALSLSSGAPSPIKLSEVKHYDGRAAIECELTPDDALYDKFSSSGLPITSGGWWPDEDEQQGRGPTGRRVGVYGVFSGDYGHGGRPEIHPFDAFWRPFHGPRSATMNWDLGVFQDDSNRFNSDWSKAPIEMELRVPFCLDVPVTTGSAVTARAHFILRRSPRCSTVGKNTRPRAGAGDLRETFTAATVWRRPLSRNRLEVSVDDRTGLPSRAISLSFGDLMYTTSRGLLGTFPAAAWLTGSIVMRVGVDQDGFAFWNLSGTNSRTAADASDGGVIHDPEASEPEVVDEAPIIEGRPTVVEVVDARAVPSAGDGGTLTAEVVVERRHDGDAPIRHSLTVGPREQPVVVDDDLGTSVRLASFDLFAVATVIEDGGAPTRTQADISAAIARVAGLPPGGSGRRSVPATLDVDPFVTVDLTPRYAPFRDGEVQGEERSRLSEAMTAAMTRPVSVRCDLKLTDREGAVRRLTTSSGPAGHDQPSGVMMSPEGSGHRLVVGPLGVEPTSVEVDAFLEDGSGLQTTVTVHAQNYRIVAARPWVEHAAGISLDDLRRRRTRVEAASRRAPQSETLAAAGLIDCLLSVLEGLDGATTVPAGQVAGALRLADRVAELMPMERPPDPRLEAVRRWVARRVASRSSGRPDVRQG